MNVPSRRPVFLGLALACLAAAGHAEDHLRLKGGELLTGKATAYDGATEIVTFVTSDGEVHELAARDLDQRSAYSLAKSYATKGDARDQLKLGNFARDIELFVHAKRHYERAEKDDPGLRPEVERERARLRKEAAEYCMRMAREAADKEDLKGAEKWLTTLVEKLPAEPLAKEASSLLQEYYARNHTARDDELEARYAELLSEDLESGKKAYDKMLNSIKAGLANTRSTSAANRHFLTAWKEGEKALRELDKVEKERGPDDPKLAELFDGYRALVKEHMISAQLHLASLFTTTTDYRRARESVNLALSLEPRNRDALAARERLENAISNNRVLGW